MTRIQVFDPAMCCNTGVCGPEVDPALVAFAADLEWLSAQGIAVERVNLARQPQLFAQDVAIRRLLDTKGDAALPAIVVDGEIRHSGRYPTRDELAQWARLPALAKIGVATANAGTSAGSCCGPAAGNAQPESTKCC